MRGVGVAFRKDLLRHVREPWGLLLWAVVPLAVGTLVFLAFGGTSGPKPVAHLLVADEDQTFASALLLGAFRQGPLADLVHVEDVTRPAGLEALDEGEASALLVVPKGLGQNLADGVPTHVLLVTNPAQQILPAIVSEAVGTLADAAFYLDRLVGPAAREIAKRAREDEKPGPGVAASFQSAGERVGRYLAGPAIVLETRAREGEGGGPPPSELFLPGIIVLGLLFASQGIADDLWRERHAGTLRRAVVSPLGAPSLLAGKVGAGVVVLAGVSLAILAAGAAATGLAPGGLPLAFLWTLLAGLDFLLLFAWLHLHASSQRAGAVLANAILFPLLMVGGSFFPTELMPRWLAAIGRWTPNGFATETLKDVLLGRASLAAVAIGAAAFLLAALLLLAVVSRRLRVVAEEGGA